MKKWLRESLKNQLIVFTLVTVLIPIGLLGLLSYITTTHLTKERATISGESSIQQLQNTLEFIINDVGNMSIFLIGNQDVQDYLQNEENVVSGRREIYGLISNLAFSKTYIDNILIEPLNGNQNISTDAIMGVEMNTNEDAPPDKWWVVKNSKETLYGMKEMITLTRPIRSTKTFELLGYLSISLNQQVIEEYLSSIDLEWSGSVLLLMDGNVLAKSSNGVTKSLDVHRLSSMILVEKNSENFIYNSPEEKLMIFHKEITVVDWDLVSLIPYHEFRSQNRYFLWLTGNSIVIAVIFIIVLVLFFISKVFRPLSALTKSIKSSNPGDNIATIESYSDNEVGELIGSYNELNDRISILMSEVKKNEHLKRELDMQALQNQINPHFLYNTLASIHWIALSSKADTISTVVFSLSNFLRFSLNKGNEYCTVEQEIGHLFHYVDIQKIRYPDSFEVKLVIEERIKQHSMLKLVLQPLIENSIIHGFFPLDDHYGVILVTAEKKEQFIYFTIKDNGVGMEKNKVQELDIQFMNDQTTEGVIGKNYGIRNVNLRLILHYGVDSRLHIASKEKEGTTIHFAIPIKGR
ncbi:sensor histidine kinase [Sporosarcina sp. ANT_H38]|uniref:sensor histidine kinase n=1 Tax=Sporosarcina sp. ANT_H38 TaxID=2597358 RepID=UPI0011F3879E|nr:sensor histidine kinase [Sporosarcina sp. ANT_H38]KAA0965082.1 sensor histidine kinase [Sporosarcina sp. ANT_H38]